MQLTTVQLKKKINNIKTFNTAIKEESDNRITNDMQFLDRIFYQLSAETGKKDLRSITNYISDIAIALSQAERGLVYLKENKEYRLISARNNERENINISKSDFSRGILYKAIQLKQLVQLIDKKLVTGQTNLNNIRLKFVMCAPMIINGEDIGAIYVDSSKPLRKAFRYTPEFFSLFGNKAAAYIRNIQYHEQISVHDKQMKLINEQLETLQKLAAKGKNASKIGHELNNLLAVIYGNIEIARSLLNKYGEGDQVLERLKKTEELLRNVGRFSKSLLKNSQFDYRFESINLNQVILDFKFHYSSYYKNSNTSFAINLDFDVPVTQADPGLIKQVLLNLVKNSIEAKPDCRILIKTIYNKARQTINLYVADNGPGFSPEKLAALFQNNYTNKPNGNGYGLMICKEIMQKHGGTISAQSSPGKGAMFIISLPVKPNENYKQTPRKQLDMIYQSL
ncbi:HAMP domain-containing histidine kinase [candidate division KSB1 bacterium]|nr:HAMP domain-containing histidine kinase [candidate division KSB1 bacterium]